MSFIPLLGVPLGLGAIWWGSRNKKRGGSWVAALGAGGIAFTVFWGSILFHLGPVQPGAYDQLRAKVQSIWSTPEPSPTSGAARSPHRDK